MTDKLPPRGPGELLRAVRAFKGYSRATVAKGAGIPKDRVEGIEFGFVMPTHDELDRIWNFLSSERVSPPAPAVTTTESGPILPGRSERP